MLRHIQSQKGGIGTYTHNLLDHLLKYDKKNHYVLIYNQRLDKTVRHLSKRYPNVEEKYYHIPSAFLWDQVVVPIICKKEKIEVIFNPKLSIPFLTRAKKVFVMHGADWVVFPKNYKPLDRLYHTIFGRLYCRFADKIISVSKNASEELCKHYKLPPEKLKTIYHGVNDSFKPISNRAKLQSIQEKYHLPEQFILFVGQIYPMKNFKGIVKAYHQIYREFPHKLVVVGKLGPNHQQDIEIIHRLKMEKEIRFLGWVPDDDLPAIYSLASFLSFPSLYEGFGIPIIEAMKCGCPVLTSDIGAPAEVACDAALLVKPKDIDAIANGMRKLLTHDQLRAQFKEKGVFRADGFTWDNCAKEVYDVLASGL